MNRRVIRIRLEKEPKDASSETSPDDSFELKTDVIRKTLESVAAKMFLGICVYMVLDTRRQVAVAKAIYHPEK